MTDLLSICFGLLLFSLLGSSTAAKDNTVVITHSGPIQGKLVPVGSGAVMAFLGIPYAEPPLGKLRFQKPVPHQPWSHVLETTGFGNSCPQIVLSGFPDAETWAVNTPRAEDCLFLNVWVPHPQPSNPAAVLVWIHGGGFSSGTASLIAYNGAFLTATENVIVVSMNYRLGSLGFLSLPPAAPGNMGLLDQQLALRWVRKSATAFGGDPAQITLFGQSAGGGAVGFHLLSPGSQPLFDRAVLQSGTPIASWAWVNPEEAKRRALTLAQRMGCIEDEDSAVVRCLQGKDMEEFQKHEFSVVDPQVMLNLPFIPTTDGDFLNDEPQKLLESGHFQAKPIMIGATSDEGSAFLLYGGPFTEMSNNSLLTWEQLLEGLRKGVRNATDDLIQAIAVRYSQAEPEGPAQYRSALSQAWGDYYFVCPLAEVATMMMKAGSPVYVYTFTHRSTGSVWPEWTGSVHGCEIPYLFGTLTLLKGTDEIHTEAELALIPRVMRYWAEFARSGNPTSSVVSETKWPHYNPAEQNFFRISTEPPHVMEPSPAQHCGFWKTLLSEASKPNRPQDDPVQSRQEGNKKQEL